MEIQLSPFTRNSERLHVLEAVLLAMRGCEPLDVAGVASWAVTACRASNAAVLVLMAFVGRTLFRDSLRALLLASIPTLAFGSTVYGPEPAAALPCAIVFYGGLRATVNAPSERTARMWWWFTAAAGFYAACWCPTNIIWLAFALATHVIYIQHSALVSNRKLFLSHAWPVLVVCGVSLLLRAPELGLFQHDARWAQLPYFFTTLTTLMPFSTAHAVKATGESVGGLRLVLFSGLGLFAASSFQSGRMCASDDAITDDSLVVRAIFCGTVDSRGVFAQLLPVAGIVAFMRDAVYAALRPTAAGPALARTRELLQLVCVAAVCVPQPRHNSHTFTVPLIIHIANMPQNIPRALLIFDAAVMILLNVVHSSVVVFGAPLPMAPGNFFWVTAFAACIATAWCSSNPHVRKAPRTEK